MRVFHHTYRAKKKTHGYYVELRDHRGKLRRLPAMTDRKASEEFGRKLERLVACRAASAALGRDLLEWLENLGAETKKRLVRLGLIPPHFEAASKPLQ